MCFSIFSAMLFEKLFFFPGKFFVWHKSSRMWRKVIWIQVPTDIVYASWIYNVLPIGVPEVWRLGKTNKKYRGFLHSYPNLFMGETETRNIIDCTSVWEILEQNSWACNTFYVGEDAGALGRNTLRVQGVRWISARVTTTPRPLACNITCYLRG